MKVRVLDKGKIKFNGEFLEEFEVYDLPDDVAEQFLKTGEVKRADEAIAKPAPEPHAPETPPFDKDANGGYVAEAKIDETKKKKLKEEGKLNDDTPVVGKDTTLPTDATPEPVEKTVVVDEATGQPLTEEEIKAREQAVAAAAQAETAPSAQDIAKAPEVA